MELRLHENIKEYRKGMKVTQAQLAEAMGVSVGTVSKWECGAMNPDIWTITELADFYQISVDVLLGYGCENRGMGQLAKHLEKLREARKFEEGMREARKALTKYPNSFQIIYQCAQTYYYAGINVSNKIADPKLRKKYFEQARKLYERSLELFDQNNDPKIEVAKIRQTIGTIYGLSAQYEKAINYLEKYNTCRINDQLIGNFASESGDYEKAERYFKEVFRKNLMELFLSCQGILNVNLNLEQYQESLVLLEWMELVLQQAADPRSSYLYRDLTVLESIYAVTYACLQKKERTDYTIEIQNKLSAAFQIAQKFEVNPEYTVKMRLMKSGLSPVHDSLGDHVLGAVKNIMLGINDDPEVFEVLKKNYNEVVREQDLPEELLL